MPPTSVVILCAILGLVFGSFLNVCITRLPRHESVVAPRSHCPRCGAPIRWYDNIPVISWLGLRGQCRSCREPIPLRYPFIELAMCGLALVCLFEFWPSWRALSSAVFCFLLLGLAAMDAETRLLPDRFTLPGLAAGILTAGLRAGFAGGTGPGFEAAALALLDAGIVVALLLIVSGVYWLVRRHAGIGWGDLKMLAMIAAWLGLPRTALTLVLALIVGAIFSAILVARLRHRATLTELGQVAIPFGVFLSVGGIYTVFLGERTLRWYLQFFH